VVAAKDAENARVAWVVVVLGGLTAVSSILASVFGAPVILLAVWSTIFTIAAALGIVKVQAGQRRKQIAERDQRQKQEQLERRKQEQLERQKESTLDQDCADLLRRAKAAVDAILASDACTHDLIHPPVDKNLLRDHVQAILVAGREITDLRAEHNLIIGSCPTCHGTGRLGRQRIHRAPEQNRSGGREPWRSRGRDPRARQGMQRPWPPPSPVAKPSPPSDDAPCPHCSGSGRTGDAQTGPMTADVIKPQKQADAIVLESVTSSLLNLERYASWMKKVDVTYRDWIGAQKAERLNERYRNLLAKTAADKLAAEEFNRLAKRAAEAERAFRQSVHEANLAAEILALPNDEESDNKES
jgi:hypothetical protein